MQLWNGMIVLAYGVLVISGFGMVYSALMVYYLNQVVTQCTRIKFMGYTKFPESLASFQAANRKKIAINIFYTIKFNKMMKKFIDEKKGE